MLLHYFGDNELYPAIFVFGCSFPLLFFHGQLHRPYCLSPGRNVLFEVQSHSAEPQSNRTEEKSLPLIRPDAKNPCLPQTPTVAEQLKSPPQNGNCEPWQRTDIHAIPLCLGEKEKAKWRRFLFLLESGTSGEEWTVDAVQARGTTEKQASKRCHCDWQPWRARGADRDRTKVDQRVACQLAKGQEWMARKSLPSRCPADSVSE
ncbi:hypothetical protein BJY04DRAFT_34625 [Aspergillus karnatakaensis]|uniref:uncharacterized protein n=1 Tax=Aspergillus karnatakaensis TaxID=1810916 RepID=UPI003CCC99B8